MVDEKRVEEIRTRWKHFDGQAMDDLRYLLSCIDEMNSCNCEDPNDMRCCPALNTETETILREELRLSRAKNKDTNRVIQYLISICSETGVGDDPVGFLIVSHAALSKNRRSCITSIDDQEGVEGEVFEDGKE